MITNTGKNILAKYLIGQAPAYASYIAIGCGPKPLTTISVGVNNKALLSNVATLTTTQAHGFEVGTSVTVSGVDETFNGSYVITSVPTTTTFTYVNVADDVTSAAVADGLVEVDYSSKDVLDFEMFRIPIISRGYVTEDGIPQVVFTGELPTEERYEITEVGIYSAGSNPAAAGFDSRTIYNFTQTENWEYHKSTGAVAIPLALGQLDADGTQNQIPDTFNGADLDVFQTNSDNLIFTYSDRIERYERPRFFNNVIAIQGNTANLTEDVDGFLEIGANSTHIHLTGVNVDLDKNAPTDKLKLAFSVLNKTGATAAEPVVDVPDNVKIMVEFASTDVSGSGEYARFEVNLDNGTSAGQHDFENNRYVVVEKELQELRRSIGFTWNIVDVVLVYVSVESGGSPSEDFYVALDSLRLDNVTTSNPLYGLTGYTSIKNTDALPVVKSANSTNFVEFRFAVGVS